MSEEGRGHRCAGLNRLHRRHAVLHVIFELLRLIDLRPRKTADVRAHGDLHASSQRLAEGATFELDERGPDATARGADVGTDGDGRDPVGAALDHRIDERIGETVAVLDRIDAGPQRGGDAVGPNRVRRNLAAQSMRFVNDRLGFRVGEIHPAMEHGVGTEEVTAVAVILDPVGAVSDLLAHR